MADLESVFSDEKTRKQVHNAAKRVCNPKKRPAPASHFSSTTAKRRAGAVVEENVSEMDKEELLALPVCNLSEIQLAGIEIQINRAPVVLAFATILLRYTLPGQPLSSRLSLAQALVSANSRSRAQTLGITPGRSPEDEGWADGQPKVTIMSRQIPIMRREGYAAELQARIESDGGLHEDATSEAIVPLWGLDLEQLRKSNGAQPFTSKSRTDLPIHTADGARRYLGKSFLILQEDATITSIKTESASDGDSVLAQLKQATAAEKHDIALGALLKAIDLLIESWADSLKIEELDRRAWSWYLRVRPEVPDGVSGWGARGILSLKSILALRKGAQAPQPTVP